MNANLPKPYRLNLIRDLRAEEREAERRRRLLGFGGFACSAVLALALAYCGYAVWEMERILSAEERKLQNVKNEYRGYTAARMTVDKADVEALDRLQGRGIFWTKKLSALAKHLPDNYWITRFSFHGGQLRVSGYGYPSARQDHLVVLDGYLKRLRRDPAFSDAFASAHLDNAEVKVEQGQGMVAFEFSALTPESAGRGPR